MITASRLRAIPRSKVAVGLGMFSFAWAFLSTAFVKEDILYNILYLSSLLIAAGIGFDSGHSRMRKIWTVACGFFALNVLLTFSRVIPFGLFGGANYLGSALALGVAGACVYRLWWYLPFAAYGLWVCDSRTAMIAAGIAIAVTLYKRFPMTALALCAIVASGVTHKPAANRSLAARIGIWQDTLAHMSPIGHGFGAFPAAYRAFAVKTNAFNENARHAYNDSLELLFDLGLGAIPLLIALILAFDAPIPDRLILSVFGILSLAFFPLFVPIVSHLAFATFGYLLKPRGYHHA